MRHQFLTSGVPILIGTVCVLVLAYLARIRRERFLLFWTYAWALLVLRFTWNAVWPTPWSAPWQGTTASFLRVAFAACLLAGVEELRGRRVDIRLVLGAAVAYIGATELLDLLLPLRVGALANLALVLLLMLATSWRLGMHRPLPRAERVFAAASLAGYAVLTGTMPLLSDGSTLLQVCFYVSWTLQLCVGFGMLALFFRSSHEAELRMEQERAARMAEVLQDFLPICMHCKAIRDERQRWRTIEEYVADRSDIRFSHGLCATCAREHYGELGTGV